MGESGDAPARRLISASPSSPCHSGEPGANRSATTYAAHPIARDSSPVASSCAWTPLIAPACWMSSALPAAASAAASITRMWRTRSCAASACAHAPPMSPAPTIATVAMIRWGILPVVTVSLGGKTAIVTGGSRGIGLAIARALAKNDANVMITGTKERPLANAVRELGAKAMAETANVRDYADVERAFNAAAARFGGIDILVNNAGVGVFAPVSSMSSDQWHDVIETNVTGVFYCTRAVLPHMRRRGGGWIISISSLSGSNPF